MRTYKSFFVSGIIIDLSFFPFDVEPPKYLLYSCFSILNYYYCFLYDLLEVLLYIYLHC